ncbi:TNF receptor-associated factor 5 [Oryzias melastigma]|uniref:TNF receptor-associated factor n=1 Tax=Oryzias melastigma TaxID=30732 RepID=A0A834F2J7_ORYME|nr:TNF receptor-associated factor 5 [Oryzias melastigma]
MASAEIDGGKSQDSSFLSGDVRRSLGSWLESSESQMRSAGSVASWESELASIQHSLKFVMKLKEEFICPICKGVVLNPQQNSCGHIYCFHCLQGLLENSSLSSPVCPVEKAAITPSEVFQDNCCKREISSLEVYCTNSPLCTSVLTLNQLQEHLKSCQFEQLQCSNPGCSELFQRRFLQEHLSSTCPHRRESCPHCLQLFQLSVIQDHVQSSCPEVKVICPDGCTSLVPRNKLTEHRESCPEVHTDCSFKTFGCSVKVSLCDRTKRTHLNSWVEGIVVTLQGKRRKVKLHEDAAVCHHVLLVLKSNAHLEQQVVFVQKEALLRQQGVQTNTLLLSDLQEQLGSVLQQNRSHEHVVSAAQRTVSRQEDALASVQLDLQQVSRGLGSGLDELKQFKKSVDGVMQELLAAESLREHLASLEENLKRHSGLLELHVAQLTLNKQHLQELELTSFDGRLIWKIKDFQKQREAEASGQTPCLSSVPFHTGRCGYKMAMKAYLNGDGEGRGTHLSLYVVLMPGDFDALLPWPFKQTVSLSVLDQSGARNHQSLNFRPDPTNKCFHQPAAESVSNVAVGFPCFISLDALEAPGNAVYVKDDTLFVKVKVDTTGLEQL